MSGLLIVKALDEKGESIWPERWSTEELMERRFEITPFHFASQYMMDPSDLSSSPLDKKWLRYYLAGEGIPPPLVHYIGIDPSPAETFGSDPNGVAILGVDPESEPRVGYLRAAYRIQISPREMVEHIKEIGKLWRPAEILIEAVAAQQLFTRFMIGEDKVAANLPIRNRPATNIPKAVRIINSTKVLARGTVRLRGERGQDGEIGPHSSVADFFEEWEDWPGGTDDVLDAFEIVLESAGLRAGEFAAVMVDPATIGDLGLGGRATSVQASSGTFLDIRNRQSPFGGRSLRDSYATTRGRRLRR